MPENDNRPTADDIRCPHCQVIILKKERIDERADRRGAPEFCPRCGEATQRAASGGSVPPLARLTVALFALLVPAVAMAQVQVQITLPQLVFPAPPQLVVVEPGVQVVPDLDDEVFFVDNSYWNRRDGRWFRSKDHRGGWVVVDGPGVPPLLVRQPPGRYRRFKPVGPPPGVPHRAAPVIIVQPGAPRPPPGVPVRATPVRVERDDDDDDDDHGKRKGKGKGNKKDKGRGHDDDD